jgi:hypothetical protein
MKQTLSRLPGHEEAAAFRVGALIATQAIAVYVEPDRSTGTYGVPCDFDRLPARLRISILAACEEEFRRRKEIAVRDSLESGDQTARDCVERPA